MSMPIQHSSRSVSQIFNSTRKSCCCSRSKRPLRIQKRNWSSTQPQLQQQQEDTSINQSTSQPPRWSRTPPGMAAPFRAKPYPENYHNRPFPANKDPVKLDAMYTKFLGKNGPNMLSDETKWQAVTHKSFDHGRRGFNDRLAFLGKRILELQCSIGLVTNTEKISTRRAQDDPFGREPFTHPATDDVEVLTSKTKEALLEPRRIARVAEMYGIPEVVRWHPRDIDDLAISGKHAVYAQTVLAILGALSLEQGGTIANRVARERVLQPSGLRFRVLAEPTQ